jgi:hypothetical protein
LGERWESSVWQAERWLTEYGYSPVAGQIDQGRIKVMRALVAQEPGRADLRRYLSASLSNLGQLAQAASDGAATLGYYEESLEVMRALVAQVSGRADWRVHLAIAYWNQYLVSDPEDERTWLEQVLGTLRPLREGKLLHGQLDQVWDAATEALQRLDSGGAGA